MGGRFSKKLRGRSPNESSRQGFYKKEYEGSDYEGPAIKMGAGVQAFEAYEFANKNYLRIIEGQCITAGLTGDYTQGEGHSILSLEYGMAADNTLEWEVVTAEGRHLTALLLLRA